jgi:hypothetical protein
MAAFSDADRAWLRAPHIARAWFGYFDLPSGAAWLHNGVGRVTVNGQEYRGVTDPVGGQLVHISAVEDPRFGQAAKVDIVIGGVNAAFFGSMKDNARELEGRVARLTWGLFDPETGEMRMFRTLMPGRMTSPTLHRKGVSERYISLGIESFWQAQNYPFGGKWTDADQRRRYPGDKGLQFVGQKVHEIWT